MNQSQLKLESTPGRRTLRIGFGAHQVVVRSTDPAVTEWLEVVFAGMFAGPAVTVGVLDVSSDGTRHSVSGPTKVPLEDGSLPDVVRCLRSSAIQLLIDARPDCFWLHAAAVARDGHVVLMPGPGGAGKSTLATALCTRGWQYLSDDVAPIQLASGNVLPFPLSPEVRQYPLQPMQEVWLRTLNKKRVTFVAGGMRTEPTPVGAVVCPVYRPDAPAQLSAWSPEECARHMLEHSWNFPIHGQAASDLVDGIVRRVPCFQLHFHDGEEAAALVGGPSGPSGPSGQWTS